MIVTTWNNDLEIGPGFYWAVARNRDTFTKKIVKQWLAVVQLYGERPFLKQETLYGSAVPDELFVVTRIPTDDAVLAEIENAARQLDPTP
jgi:hypothetical protein